ncbi:MAG: hormogonium polysaccharide biosynthesis protein HpsA, partial [Pseudanabaena sp.]
MSDSKQSRKINRFFAEFIAKLRKWLNKIGSPIRISRRFVRQLLGATKGQRKDGAAGFVLPTVTLVTLVVTLLVVTTVSRSSERAQTAANGRTEQVFKSAATPIIDRARAKIDALLNDGKLPRTTPSELTLDSVITSDSGKYTLPDETRLQLVYNFRNPTANPPKINYTDGQIENREYVSSAWKFPIDTDNNGKFDSFGLYSILFRARPPSVTTRPVVPIESRALPMDETTLSGACVATGGVTNIAGDGGWTNSSDKKLRKSFFVYAVTVPIQDAASFPTTAAGDYEVYNGLNAISAVELQQDRARSPQNNNAVFFEGDTELVNVATFRLNGRLYSAGNLMVGAGTDNPITLFQVSSSGGTTSNGATTNPDLFGSCYYEKKNSEIIVAGNVVEGDAINSNPANLSSSALGRVNVHLFRGAGVPPVANVGGRTGIIELNETNQSVDSTIAGNLSSDLALNDFAFNNRIGALVDAAIALRGQATVNFPLPANFSASDLSYLGTKDPTSVQADLVKRIQDEALSSQAEVNAARRAAYTAYFGERTRKVSFREVAFGAADPLPTPFLTPIIGSDV